ncbi:hypothetical protein SPRG_12967 [Saprolegnia parasitica CBS 223.65]|uniref:Secreted protein n=1 Tax=Saprolegnia parasitica (strain CBS 223.65) TaxID=695850 RepID=A0A067BUV0_SAPPC|nr:hypothetical protein SPRG_12967 [Saprolegnia parasitica CBS 223.65]KDO20610.1 hypothetical protein SPRG_12967 [Saprolegnia parasitica CBS 223.65]|eukprot:XP_012208665.1 hypothetical protein SPRG_12967 [Saprolegnia parasitica CBS 223.65]
MRRVLLALAVVATALETPGAFWSNRYAAHDKATTNVAATIAAELLADLNATSLPDVLPLLSPLLRGSPIVFGDGVTSIDATILRLSVAKSLVLLPSLRAPSALHSVFVEVHIGLWQTPGLDDGTTFMVQHSYVQLLLDLWAMASYTQAEARHALMRCADASWQQLRTTNLTPWALVHYKHLRSTILCELFALGLDPAS